MRRFEQWSRVERGPTRGVGTRNSVKRAENTPASRRPRRRSVKLTNRADACSDNVQLLCGIITLYLIVKRSDRLRDLAETGRMDARFARREKKRRKCRP